MPTLVSIPLSLLYWIFNFFFLYNSEFLTLQTLINQVTNSNTLFGFILLNNEVSIFVFILLNSCDFFYVIDQRYWAPFNLSSMCWESGDEFCAAIPNSVLNITLSKNIYYLISWSKKFLSKFYDKVLLWTSFLINNLQVIANEVILKDKLVLPYMSNLFLLKKMQTGVENFECK